MNGGNIQTFELSFYNAAGVTYRCDSSFQGGGWVLVRRVRQGSAIWFPTTDDLFGSDVYGTYGGTTSDLSFSIPYSSWVSGSTEFLFATGVIDCRVFSCGKRT
jgi:hypothetical protein